MSLAKFGFDCPGEKENLGEDIGLKESKIEEGDLINLPKLFVDKKGEGYYLISFNMSTRSDLNGAVTNFHANTSYVMPREFLGSCYAGKGNIEDPVGFFKDELEHKKEVLRIPYKDLKVKERDRENDKIDESNFYRLVPAKSFGIQIYQSTIDHLKTLGFDLYKWWEEYNSLPEFVATPIYDLMVQSMSELGREGLSIEGRAKMIIESIRYKLGKRETYGARIYDKFTDKTIDELLKMIDDLKKELVTVNDEMKEIRKQTGHYYHESYSDFDDGYMSVL